MRERERKKKQADQIAVCGINFYTLRPRERDRGCYWTHCRTYGKELRYFDMYEPAQPARALKGRPSKLHLVHARRRARLEPDLAQSRIEYQTPIEESSF